MAFILSLDTSGKTCSVAVHEDGKCIASEAIHTAQSHGRELAPLIKRILKKDGRSIRPDAVVVSSGPGSYTGLRIGVSTAKGICAALNIPLIELRTLPLMARMAIPQATDNCLLCPMIDARRMEVYCMLLDPALNVVRAEEAVVVEDNPFLQLLDTNTIFFFGDGIEKCRPVISHPNARFIDVAEFTAEDMGAPAFVAYTEGLTVDLMSFEPFYLKPVHTTQPRAERIPR